MNTYCVLTCITITVIFSPNNLVFILLKMRKILTHKQEVFNIQQCIDTKIAATSRMYTKREDQVMPAQLPITSSLIAYALTFQPANHSSPAQPKLTQVK